MKPGGPCSPSAGSERPSGDEIGLASACRSKDEGSHVILTPASREEKCYDTVDAHHQTASAHSGVVNGYLPNDLPNGIYDLSHKEKESDDIPCGKLSPCTKDGYSKALPLCGVTPSSVSGRTGESALYQGRSNISPSQASILDHFGTARIQCQTSEMSLGQSRLPVPGMFGPACVSGESKISSSRADNQRTLQCGKSPKYRRKFSLEEMVAKLHNRTELNTTCVNVLQGFPSVRPLVDSGRKMVAAENNQSNLCDKHNTAICDDARPSSPSTPLSSLKDASDKCDVDKPSKESERSCTVECPVNVSSNKLTDSLDMCKIVLEKHFLSEAEKKDAKVSYKGDLDILSIPEKTASPSESVKENNTDVCEDETLIKYSSDCSNEVEDVVENKTSDVGIIGKRTDQQNSAEKTLCNKDIGTDVFINAQINSNEADILLQSNSAITEPVNSDEDGDHSNPIGNVLTESLTKVSNAVLQKSSVSLPFSVTDNTDSLKATELFDTPVPSGDKVSKENDITALGLSNPSEKVSTDNSSDGSVKENIECPDTSLLRTESDVPSPHKANTAEALTFTTSNDVSTEPKDTSPSSWDCSDSKTSFEDKSLDKNVDYGRNENVQTIVDLTCDLESVGSSSVDMLDFETRDSGSDLEILYEKCKDHSATTSSLYRRACENVLQANLDGKGLPSIINCDNGSVQYLEPISDDENSLLCAPSPPSTLSLVSGIPSSSNTPLFSDTPSDASRGAIMVKISDAVAAILSDVSDDSLPPSPEESDINILKSFSNILPSLKNDEVRKSTSEDRLHEGEKSTTEKYVSDKSNKNVKACNIDGATDELAQRPTDKCVNDEEPVTGRLLQQGQVSNEGKLKGKSKEISSDHTQGDSLASSFDNAVCRKSTKSDTISSDINHSPQTSEDPYHSQSENKPIHNNSAQSISELAEKIADTASSSLKIHTVHTQDVASSTCTASSVCQMSTSGPCISSQIVDCDNDSSSLKCSALSVGTDIKAKESPGVNSQSENITEEVKEDISKEPNGQSISSHSRLPPKSSPEIISHPDESTPSSRSSIAKEDERETLLLIRDNEDSVSVTQFNDKILKKCEKPVTCSTPLPLEASEGIEPHVATPITRMKENSECRDTRSSAAKPSCSTILSDSVHSSPNTYSVVDSECKEDFNVAGTADNGILLGESTKYISHETVGNVINSSKDVLGNNKSSLERAHTPETSEKLCSYSEEPCQRSIDTTNSEGKVVEPPNTNKSERLSVLNSDTDGTMLHSQTLTPSTANLPLDEMTRSDTSITHKTTADKNNLTNISSTSRITGDVKNPDSLHSATSQLEIESQVRQSSENAKDKSETPPALSLNNSDSTLAYNAKKKFSFPAKRSPKSSPRLKLRRDNSFESIQVKSQEIVSSIGCRSSDTCLTSKNSPETQLVTSTKLDLTPDSNSNSGNGNISPSETRFQSQKIHNEISEIRQLSNETLSTGHSCTEDQVKRTLSASDTNFTCQDPNSTISSNQQMSLQTTGNSFSPQDVVHVEKQEDMTDSVKITDSQCQVGAESSEFETVSIDESNKDVVASHYSETEDHNTKQVLDTNSLEDKELSQQSYDSFSVQANLLGAKTDIDKDSLSSTEESFGPSFEDKMLHQSDSNQNSDPVSSTEMTELNTGSFECTGNENDNNNSHMNININESDISDSFHNSHQIAAEMLEEDQAKGYDGLVDSSVNMYMHNDHEELLDKSLRNSSDVDRENFENSAAKTFLRDAQDNIVYEGCRALPNSHDVFESDQGKPEVHLLNDEKLQLIIHEGTSAQENNSQINNRIQVTLLPQPGSADNASDDNLLELPDTQSLESLGKKERHGDVENYCEPLNTPQAGTKITNIDENLTPYIDNESDSSCSDLGNSYSEVKETDNVCPVEFIDENMLNPPALTPENAATQFVNTSQFDHFVCVPNHMSSVQELTSMHCFPSSSLTSHSVLQPIIHDSESFPSDSCQILSPSNKEIPDDVALSEVIGAALSEANDVNSLRQEADILKATHRNIKKDILYYATDIGLFSVPEDSSEDSCSLSPSSSLENICQEKTGYKNDQVLCSNAGRDGSTHLQSVFSEDHSSVVKYFNRNETPSSPSDLGFQTDSLKDLSSEADVEICQHQDLVASDLSKALLGDLQLPSEDGVLCQTVQNELGQKVAGESSEMCNVLVDGEVDNREREKTDSQNKIPCMASPAKNMASEGCIISENNRNKEKGDSLSVKVDEVKRELISPCEEDSKPFENLDNDHDVMYISVANENATVGNDNTQELVNKVSFVGSPCSLCQEMLHVPLEEHVIAHHSCVTFMPAKRTWAYQCHMQLRVDDTDVINHQDTREHAYVCHSCPFSSRDINAVRFHLNIHEDVFQVLTGRALCDCNQKVYSYEFHRWKILIHNSPYVCYECNQYFACETSRVNHLQALHYPNNLCKICDEVVPHGEIVEHTNMHKSEKDAVDEEEAELEDARITTRGKGSYGISWNIHDNNLNYVDGKYFRLSTSSKVPDNTRNRSYLQLPIKNVLDDVKVPDKIKLDPGRDIRKYLQGKRDIKSTDAEINEALKNFSWFVQMDFEKKSNLKKSKSKESHKTRSENELFEILRINSIKPKYSVKKEKTSGKGKTSKKKSSNVAQDAFSLSLPSGHENSSLTRTRSGMQSNKEEGEEEEKFESFQIHIETPEVSISGEWSRDRTYVCCSCGICFQDLADMMDHKWEYHPSVWCAHTMFEGQNSVPQNFCKQFQPPASRPHRLPLPTVPLPKTQEEPLAKNEESESAEKSHYVCSSCNAGFSETGLFHSHLLECGGLNQVVVVKKKNKKGFRFKRRKGQGVPSNRYGIGSLPSTPMKAKFGDRSSGLNTPPVEKSNSSTVHSSGVKRRLELAVGSINNDELKSRLKAIISKSKSSSFNPLGIPSRRTIRMKLRKKALDTKWLRKTRHSDKVKEETATKSQKSEDKKVSNTKEEKKEGAEVSKDKKLSVGTEKNNDTEIKAKSQKKSGKATVKKGDRADANRVNVEIVNPMTTSPALGNGPLSISKKKTKAPKILGSNSLHSEKKINGVISGNKPKISKDTAKIMSESSVQTKSIDIKKALARKILAKKNKNVSNVRDIAKSDKVCDVIEPENSAGNIEISVQKKAKLPGKNKSNLNQNSDALRESSKSVKSNNKHPKYGNASQIKTTTVVIGNTEIDSVDNLSKPKAKKLPKSSLVGKVADTVKNSLVKKKVNAAVSLKKDSLPNVQTGSVAFGKVKNTSKVVYSADAEPTPVSLAGTKKSKYVIASSSEESEEDSGEDSEPEVIRNFRSGRGCTGRMGLRNKSRPTHSRYSFRTCIVPAKEVVGNEDKEGDKHEKSVVGSGLKIKNDEADLPPSNLDQMDDIPLSKRRKRKIDSFENLDDCAYVPSSESEDDDDYPLKDLISQKVKNIIGRKKPKLSKPHSTTLSSARVKQPQEIVDDGNKALGNEETLEEARELLPNDKVSAKLSKKKNLVKKSKVLFDRNKKKEVKKNNNAVDKVKSVAAVNTEVEAQESGEVSLPALNRSNAKVKKQAKFGKPKSHRGTLETPDSVGNKSMQNYKMKRSVKILPDRKKSANDGNKVDLNVESTQESVLQQSNIDSEKSLENNDKTLESAPGLKHKPNMPKHRKERSKSFTIESVDKVQEKKREMKHIRKSSSLTDISLAIDEKKSDNSKTTPDSNKKGSLSLLLEEPSSFTRKSVRKSSNLQIDKNYSLKKNVRMKNAVHVTDSKIGTGIVDDTPVDVSHLDKTAEFASSPIVRQSEDVDQLISSKPVIKRGRKSKISSFAKNVVKSGVLRGKKPKRVKPFENLQISDSLNSTTLLEVGLENKRRMPSRFNLVVGDGDGVKKHSENKESKVRKPKKNIISEEVTSGSLCDGIIATAKRNAVPVMETFASENKSTSSTDKDLNESAIRFSRKRKLKVEDFLPSFGKNCFEQAESTDDDHVPSKKIKTSLKGRKKATARRVLIKPTKLMARDNFHLGKPIPTKKSCNKSKLGNSIRSYEKESKPDYSLVFDRDMEKNSPIVSKLVLEHVNDADKDNSNFLANHDIMKEDSADVYPSAKVKRRRPSLEKLKDIPTRSSVAVQTQDNPSPSQLHNFIDELESFKQEEFAPSEETTSTVLLPRPKVRRRRTQVSHDHLGKEGLGTKSQQFKSHVEPPVPSSKFKGNDKLADKNISEAPIRRKRASYTSGMPKKNKLGTSDVRSSYTTDTELINAKVLAAKPKKTRQRKKTDVSVGSSDVKCLECGLRFDSLASLEDHRQDCLTIALEMSLMEAEDHLFECPHCHLTFALKSTQRQHTASCRLVKYKRHVHKNDAKVRRKASRRTRNAKSSWANPDLEAVFMPREVKEQAIAGAILGTEVHPQSFSLDQRQSEVVDSRLQGNVENETNVQMFFEGNSRVEYDKETITDLKVSPRFRRRSRTNGKVEISEGADQVSDITSEEKCVVCGFEIKDKDMSNKHLLLEQFAHCCQEQVMLEVCVLLAYYNLGVDTLKSLVASAIMYQGTTILKLDAKQQTRPVNDLGATSAENKCASQLYQILSSPHCTWLSPVLADLAKNYYSVEAVTITGSRQEALKAISVLEELFKEIANVDSVIRKNHMLRTMKETFESGTL